MRARTAGENESLANGKDSVWYNGEQACNASLAPDGSKRTAFLDFGSETGKAFAGKSYQAHAYLLIADSTGALTQMIPAPSGYQFDHTEWAGEKSLVGTLTNSDGAHSKIVILNVKDSSYLSLAESDELWHPVLWTKKKFTVTNPTPTPIPDTSKVDTSSVTKPDSSKADTSSVTKPDSSKTDTSSVTQPDSSKTDTSSTTKPDSSKADTTAADTSGSQISFVLDPDSAGQYYNNSGACSMAIQWRFRMEFLWHYRDSANLVIIGSSRAFHGFNPTLFNDSIFAINLAVSATVITSNVPFAKNYILPHVKNLKVLVVALDLDRGIFLGEKLSADMFHSRYLSYAGFVYDKNHNYWQDGVPEDLYQYTKESPGNPSWASRIRETRGYLVNNANSWGNPKITKDSTWFSTNSSTYYKNFNAFVELLEACQEKGITVIGVLTPQNPAYKETGAYGLAGLQRSKAVELIEELSALHDTYPNFYLMDENKMGDHDYTDDMAFDTDHLADAGATQLTHRLDSLITSLGIFK